MGNYNNEEKEIDVIQLILYLWDHAVIIILVGIIGAALLGAFGYRKQVKYQTSEADIFKSIVMQNHNAANNTTTETILNSERTPIDGTCIVRVALYIDYNLSSIENNDNLDYNQLMSRLQADVSSLLVSNDALNDVVEDVNSKKYGGLEPIKAEELRWIININTYGANVIQFSVTDVNEERAIDIATIVTDRFVKAYSDYEIFDEIRVLEAPSVYSNSVQEDKNNNINIKNLLKYIIVGGVAGIFFACLLYLILYIIKDGVRTTEDLERIGLTELGRIPLKDETREKEYRRTAYNIDLLGEKKRIMIVPIDSRVKTSELVEKLNEELKKINQNHVVFSVENIKDNPDALVEAKKADGIIIAVKFGDTNISALKRNDESLAKTNKEIIGVVVLDCKR